MSDDGRPVPNASQQSQVAKSPGYFEATRSDDALELLAANQDAFALAYYIASRANWHGGFNRHGCAFGETFLGAGATDSYGMGKGDKGENRYRRAKLYLVKWKFATFKATNKGTIGKLTDTRLFKNNPPKSDGQNDVQATDSGRTADGRPTTNLNLKAGKQESYKAFSTKASKLSASQKELADRFEAALGDEWTNDAGKWIGRIKTSPGKSQRVIAEVESAAKEKRIKATPAAFAEDTWKRFAP
jgi:hypothetical protein